MSRNDNWMAVLSFLAVCSQLQLYSILDEKEEKGGSRSLFRGLFPPKPGGVKRHLEAGSNIF